MSQIGEILKTYHKKPEETSFNQECTILGFLPSNGNRKPGSLLHFHFFLLENQPYYELGFLKNGIKMKADESFPKTGKKHTV